MATDVQKVQERGVRSGDLPGSEKRSGLTLRSVGLGLFLVVGLDLMAVYVRYIFHGSLMTYSHIPMSMLMVFMLMMLGGSVISRYTGFVLSPSEWHTVLAMGVVGAAVPGFGHAGYLLGYISAPYYFATAENQWDTYLHPYIPKWLIPSNEGNAVSWFFEGLPRGAEIPWDVWVLPLFWWFTFVGAAFVMLACVAAIFRKQWVQNERLVYPAMAPLLDMVSGPGSGKRSLPEFTRNYLFWIGFGIAFGMIAWNCINYFLPGFPRRFEGFWGFSRSSSPTLPAWTCSSASGSSI